MKVAGFFLLVDQIIKSLPHWFGMHLINVLQNNLFRECQIVNQDYPIRKER